LDAVGLGEAIEARVREILVELSTGGWLDDDPAGPDVLAE
jgi:hypothetical protein